MFATFFHELKAAGVPVTLREYLTLMEAMEKNVASRRVEDFYYLSRAALVKDERNLDKFDRVFGHVFKAAVGINNILYADVAKKIGDNGFVPTAAEISSSDLKIVNAEIAFLHGFDVNLATVLSDEFSTSYSAFFTWYEEPTIWAVVLIACSGIILLAMIRNVSHS